MTLVLILVSLAAIAVLAVRQAPLWQWALTALVLGVLFRFSPVNEGREQTGGRGCRGAPVAVYKRVTPDNALHESCCFLEGEAKCLRPSDACQGRSMAARRVLVTNARSGQP